MEQSSSSHALLGKVEYPLVQSRLRAWLELEEIYADIVEAAASRDRERFVSSLYSYVSVAFSVPIETLQECPWYEITRAITKMFNLNHPSFEFPMLFRKTKEKINHKITEEGWEYPGRTWYIWLHALAKEYGWSIEYIENLHLDDGIALLEEILLDGQFEREFQWSMSQNAYSYDENTKQSKFNALDRPEWMRPVPKPEVKVQMKKSDLPAGVVLRWDRDEPEKS